MTNNNNDNNNNDDEAHWGVLFQLPVVHDPGEWTSALSNLLSFCRTDEDVKFEAQTVSSGVETGRSSINVGPFFFEDPGTPRISTWVQIP